MIYTVFSSEDTPYMHWQSLLLEYSWKRVDQPGELIRLVSTDDPRSLPRHEHARCVPVRSWKIHPFSGDDFAPYNKPSGLLEWIYRERPYGTLLVLDSDCVFRAPIEREVTPGSPVGQLWDGLQIGHEPPFGLGEVFEGVSRYCVEDAPRADPVMIPHLIHSCDMQKLALRWLELTAAVREHARDPRENKLWESDRFGFIMASAERGLKHELGNLGIATGHDPDSGPDRDTEQLRDAPIVHYHKPVRDAHGEVVWDKGSYRPWERVQDPSRATVERERDLLELVNEYIDQRAAEHGGVEPMPRQRPGVLIRKRGDETELFPPGSDQAFVLNASAEAIWDLCDGAHSPTAIADELGPRFEIEPDAILGDVRMSIRALDGAGVLDI